MAMLMRKVLVGTSCVLLLGGLAGCGSGGGRHPTTTTVAVQGGSARQQALPIWQEYARCARTHGAPNFRDFIVDDQGRAQPSGGGLSPAQFKQLNLRVQGACGAILRRLPSNTQTKPPLSNADVQHLRQFAACIRQHGIPNWPDPKADGSFPVLGTPLGREGKSGRFVAAAQACRQYWSGRTLFS